MKHKNVVQFIKFFEDAEHVFIILEYCGTKVGSTNKIVGIKYTLYFLLGHISLRPSFFSLILAITAS